MIYDQNELQSAIEDGERKLAQRRQQRRTQRKQLIFGAALLALLVPFGLVAAIVSKQAPPAPLLVVTWPKPKTRQVLAPGQTVLARTGQPFFVEVTNPENWDVKWRAQGIESGDSELSWSPASGGDELVASCRARVEGWKKFFAWTWPRREVVLRAIAERAVGDYARAIDARSGTWVYPHIFAVGKVSFDERALAHLDQATEDLPQKLLGRQLTPVADTPAPPIWNIVSDFEATNANKFADADENGTFASLKLGNVETALPQVAGTIAQKLPTASVKFVLRLDRKPPQGILRVAFDGKAERRAWVRRAGESAGGPFTGWEGGEEQPGLPPALPANQNR